MKKNFEKLLSQQIKKVKYKFSLGALIIKDNRIISAGYNRIYNINQNKHTADCAELLAIKKAPRSQLKDSIIIVCRKNKSGSYGMAKPCKRCERAIKKAGIVKIYYSTPIGWKKYKN